MAKHQQQRQGYFQVIHCTALSHTISPLSPLSTNNKEYILPPYSKKMIMNRDCLNSRIFVKNYRQFTWINFCYLVAPIFRGEFRIIFTNKHGLKKIPRTANCPKNLHVKNEVILWPLTSSKIIVLVAQPILTDGGATCLGSRQEDRTGLAK